MNRLLSYFGPKGSLYEDARVLDVLDNDPIDRPVLDRLLLSIEETWIRENGPLDQETDLQRRASFYSLVLHHVSNIVCP